MLGGIIDCVSDGVVAIDSLIFRGASDSVVAINIGIFSASWTRMGRIVDRKPKPILQSNSKILGND